MKKTQEILGLPIISISDGLEVGKVKSIIINADKGAIDYIVVDNGIQILSARVIPTDSILGIGEYAVTIESDSSINDISKIPAAIDLLQKNIQVKGTKVLTKKGRLIGEIGDIFVDENDCCKITGLEYIADITQKRIRLIPRESVLTFGKNLIVVIEEVENTLVDRATQLGSGENQTEAEKKNLESFNSAVDELEFKDEIASEETNVASATEPDILKGSFVSSEPDNFTIDNDSIINDSDVLNFEDTNEINVGSEVFNIADNGEIVTLNSDEAEVAAGSADITDENPVSNEINAAGLFEQRQKQYLNGRRSTKTIADNSGNIIISEGMVINHEIIETAKNAGKLIELVMNNKA